jgi:hypothetical protein
VLCFMRSHKTRVCLGRGNLGSWITVNASESYEIGDALSSLLFLLPVVCHMEWIRSGTNGRLSDFILNSLDEEAG